MLLLLLLHLATASSPCPLGEITGNIDNLLYHPRFHIMPPTRTSRPTGMNDINAMFYHDDLYHVTYQDHLNCPDDLNQMNQTFGHVVSRDLIHWKHLPPALVDNITFDGKLGPWDGPGFICNGKPMIIYASHFDGEGFNNQTKTAAFPFLTTAIDPLLTRWIRSPLEPENAFQGPGTILPPWKDKTDAAGGGSSAYYTAVEDMSSGDCQLWRTTDERCLKWEIVSSNFTFCTRANPEMWKTPRLVDGQRQQNVSQNVSQNFSMVAKQTVSWQESMGDSYIFGKLNGVGKDQVFVPSTNSLPGGQKGFNGKEIPGNVPIYYDDMYHFEGIKRNTFEDGRGSWSSSLYDPVGDRRIQLAWVPPGVTPAYAKPIEGFLPLFHTTTLLRDIRFDNQLKRLTSFPLEEYAQLREKLLADIAGKVLIADDGKENKSNQERRRDFHLGSGRQLDVLVEFALWFPINDYSTTAGVSLLRNANGSSRVDVSLRRLDNGESGSAEEWMSLSIDTGFVGPSPPGHNNTYPSTTVHFPLVPLADNGTVRLRVVFDRSIVEVFAQGGRAAATATPFAPAENSAFSLFVDGNTNASVEIINAKAWSMGCGWELEI